jgi:hypothetical protein
LKEVTPLLSKKSGGVGGEVRTMSEPKDDGFPYTQNVFGEEDDKFVIEFII